MKAVRFHRLGPPDVLMYDDVPEPSAGPGEILIRVEAAGVNYADGVRRNGDPYPVPTPLPFIPGADVAGVVAALGADVDGPSIGSRVAAFCGASGYAQYVVVPAAMATVLPENFDFAMAAALPIQGLTAALILTQAAKLRPGETVLIPAAAGGTGLILVQLAKLMGAGKIIATASTAAKRQIALDLGADIAIDYTDSAWPALVREATDGRGVDIVLEMVGGAVTQQSLACLTVSGRMVVYGVASKAPTAIESLSLIGGNFTVIGFYRGAYMADQALIRATMADLVAKVNSGDLQLTIGGVFPLERAAEAHRLMEGRASTGKLVLLPWGADAS